MGYGSFYGNAFNTKPYDPYKYVPGIPENNPFKVVDRSAARIEAAGYEVPERKGIGIKNGLMTALDLMQRPQSMVTNVLDNWTDGDQTNNGFSSTLKAAFDGATGARKSSFTDTLNNLDWEAQANPTGKWYNPLSWNANNVARNVVGFAGDVLLDPTTYMGLGSLKMAKNAIGDKTAAAIMEKLGAPTANMADNIASVLGKSADDVNAGLSKFGKRAPVVGRLAEVLGTDAASAQRFMDNGLTAFDDAGIKGFQTQAFGRKQAAEAVLKPEMETLDKSLRKVLGAKNYDRLGVGEKLTNSTGSTVDQLRNILKPYDTEIFTSDLGKVERRLRAPQLYDAIEWPTKAQGRGMRSSLDRMPDQAFDSLVELHKVFGSDFTLRELRDVNKKTYGYLSKNDDMAGKLMGSFDSVGRTHADKVAADNAIELGNNLVAVMDEGFGSFHLRYQNPFTGTVKPLIDIGKRVDAVTSKVGKSLQESEKIAKIIGFKPVNNILRTGVEVKDMLGKLFQPEYISTALKASGYAPAAGHVVDAITDIKRKSTGLAQQAYEGAVGSFADLSHFLSNNDIQRAATYYIQRGNSTKAEVFWQLIEGRTPQDIMADLTDNPKAAEALEAILNNRNTVDLLNKLKLKNPAQDLAEIKMAAERSKIFHESLFQFDSQRNLKFGEASVDPGTYVHQSSRVDKKLSDVLGIGQKQSDTLRMRTSTMAGSMDEQKVYPSFVERVMDMGGDAQVDNLVAAMSLREMDSLRVAMNREFVEGLKRDMATVEGLGDLVKYEPAQGLVRIQVGQETLHVHKDIAEQFNRIAESFYTDTGQKQLLQYYDQMTNMLKQMQTSWNPSFVMRNAIGEPMMNWIAGVGLKSHDTAAQILKEIGHDKFYKVGDTTFVNGTPLYRKAKAINPDGSFGDETVQYLSKEAKAKYDEAARKYAESVPGEMSSPSVWDFSENVAGSTDIALKSMREKSISDYGLKTYNIGGQQLTGEEVADLFREGGLGWSTISRGNLVENLETAIKKEVRRTTSKRGLQAVPDAIRESADYVETWTRLAHMIERLDNGYSWRDAIEDVRKYHVDYKDLTKFEADKMRRLMPYYTYMRKNLPIQMRALLEHQNKINMIGKLVNHSKLQAQEQNGGVPIAMDDYLTEGMAIPLSVDEQGNVQYLNWNLPISDLGRLTLDMKDFADKNLFDMLSPLIKIPFELNTNLNTKFGAEIEKFEGEEAGLLRTTGESTPNIPIPKKVDYAMQQMGVVNSLRKALGQGMDVATGQAPDPTKPRNPLTYALLDSILPVRSQQAALNTQAYNYRDQLLEHMKYLQQEGVELPDYTPQMGSKPRMRYTPR